MNPKQRYHATLAGHPVDHLARLPVLMQFAAEPLGSNYGALASDYRVFYEANIACACEFGIDQMSAISDPIRETPGYGAKIIIEPNVVLYCKKHPLEDADNYEGLPRPHPTQADRMRDRIEAIRCCREQVGNEYSITGRVEGPAAEATDFRQPRSRQGCPPGHDRADSRRLRSLLRRSRQSLYLRPGLRTPQQHAGRKLAGPLRAARSEATV